MLKYFVDKKDSLNLAVSNAGHDSPNIGLFLFTAIQHIPLKSFAGFPGPALDTGDFSGYFLPLQNCK